jgi:hypothetical protein
MDLLGAVAWESEAAEGVVTDAIDAELEEGREEGETKETGDGDGFAEEEP